MDLKRLNTPALCTWPVQNLNSLTMVYLRAKSVCLDMGVGRIFTRRGQNPYPGRVGVKTDFYIIIGLLFDFQGAKPENYPIYDHFPEPMEANERVDAHVHK